MSGLGDAGGQALHILCARGTVWACPRWEPRALGLEHPMSPALHDAEVVCGQGGSPCTPPDGKPGRTAHGRTMLG